MENISHHISYAEAIYSQIATRHKYDNNPPCTELARMGKVAVACFEPTRKHFGVPIRVSSFYRSAKVNKAAKGSISSQHMKGEAIDIEAIPGTGITNADIFNFIRDNLEFDQLIWEYGDKNQPAWVHVSYTTLSPNRMQILTIK